MLVFFVHRLSCTRAPLTLRHDWQGHIRLDEFGVFVRRGMGRAEHQKSVRERNKDANKKTPLNPKDRHGKAVWNKGP